MKFSALNADLAV